MGFSPSGIGTGGSGGSATSVSTPAVQNVSALVANTEYTITIPSTVKRFALYSRSLGTMKIAYIVGETATNFLTVDYGNVYSEADLSLSGALTIYFRSNKSNDVIEVNTWS